MADREILEAVLAEVKELGTQIDRIEKNQERFEEETRNNFADLRLHLENITDRNIAILTENYINLMGKINMPMPIEWKNRILFGEIKMSSLEDQITELQAKCK